MLHLINQLSFELNCTSEEEALNLRQNFAATLQSEIAEVVDELCSKYVTGQEEIRIDRIEIDLGRLSPHALSMTFKDLFRYQFEKQLCAKISLMAPQSRQASLQVTKFEVLCWYLLHGALPWWASESETDMDIIAEEVLEKYPSALYKFLYSHRAKKILWERIAYQFPFTIQKNILELFEELKKTKELLFAWLTRSGEVGYSSFDLNIEDTRYVDPKKSIVSFVLFQAPVYLKASPEIIPLLLKQSVHMIFPDGQTNEEVRRLKLCNIIDNINVQEHTTLTNSSSLYQQSSAAEANKQIPDPADDIFTQLTANSSDSVEEEEGERKYFVLHAGVILLAPFFKPFFKELGLLKGNGWKDQEAQFRALHLLKFLSTGEEQPAEYQMVLEKLICGLPIEYPVARMIELHDKEIREAELLLLSVIEHWKILKNTSINGLRENFLKRDGLIRQQENGWLLQIERKTLDVLLDSLPWGFSTVKLPWNHFPIFVEW